MEEYRRHLTRSMSGIRRGMNSKPVTCPLTRMAKEMEMHCDVALWSCAARFIEEGELVKKEQKMIKKVQEKALRHLPGRRLIKVCED